MPARQAVFFSQHICLYFISSGVDSGVAGGARAPPEFGGLEKRTEREIDNLLLRTLLDLKRNLTRCIKKHGMFLINHKQIHDIKGVIFATL